MRTYFVILFKWPADIEQIVFSSLPEKTFILSSTDRTGLWQKDTGAQTRNHFRLIKKLAVMQVVLFALKNQTYTNGKRSRLTSQSCCINRYRRSEKVLPICILKKWQKKICYYIAISYIVSLLRVSQCWHLLIQSIRSKSSQSDA